MDPEDVDDEVKVKDKNYYNLVYPSENGEPITTSKEEVSVEVIEAVD